MKIDFKRPRTWMDPVGTARNKQSRCVCQRFDCESVLNVSFFRAITRINMGMDSVCSGRKIDSASRKHVEKRRLWGDFLALSRT